MTNTINFNPSCYQPQSRDTSSKIDRFLTLAFRRMPARKKVFPINEAAIKRLQQWALIGICNQTNRGSLGYILRIAAWLA